MYRSCPHRSFSPGVVDLYWYSSCFNPRTRSGSCIESSVEYGAAPDVLARQSSSILSVYSGLPVSPMFLCLETTGELAQTS